MMDPGNIAVFIPIIALMIPIIAIWAKHQRKMTEMRLSTVVHDTAERAAQYASHIQALEERVRVLERILTDQSYETAAQIEALRDQQIAEDLPRARQPETPR